MSGRAENGSRISLPYALARFGGRLRKLWASCRISPWELGFLTTVAVAATAFAGVSFARYWSFDSRTWDLGYYSLDYLKVAHGQFPPLLPHFSPIVYLFVPLLLAFPFPTTLLALQAVAVAGSGVPVFWLALDATRRERVAFVVGTAYLAGFLPLSLAWFDFHIETFLPLFLLTALYARQRSHAIGFSIAIGFALATAEASVVLTLVLSAFLYLSARFSQSVPAEKRRRDRRLSMIVAGLAVAWTILILAAFVFVPASAGGAAFDLSSTVRSPVPGASGVGGLPFLFTQALHAVPLNLVTNLPAKGVYLLVFLAAFGFLSVLGDPVEVSPALLWFGYVFTSYQPSIFSFGNQYASYAVPFLAAGAISALGRIYSGVRILPARLPPLRLPRRFQRLHGHAGSAAVCLLIAGLVVTSVASDPLRTDPLAGDPVGTFGPPLLTAHERLLHDVIAALPPGAVVVTTNNLFPEVSADPASRFFAISPVELQNNSLASAFQGQVSGAQYVLLDYIQDWTNAAAAALDTNLSGFHLAEAGDGIRLYAAGPTPQPVRFVAAETTHFAPQDFIAAAARPNASTGESLSYPAQPTAPTPWLWFGPNYYQVAPGHYTITAQVSAVSTPGPSGFELEVVYVPVVLVETLIPIGPGVWISEFHLAVAESLQQVLYSRFVASTTTQQMQFPVLPFNWTGPGGLALIGKNPLAEVAINLYGATLQNSQDPL